MNALTLVRVLTCAAALWLGAVGASGAGDAPLVLSPGEHKRGIAQHIQFLRDPTGQLGVGRIMEGEAGQFRDLPDKRIDFGFTPDTIWLRLSVINSGDREGTWLLATDTNFMNRLDAYLVRDGDVRLIVSDSKSKPFSAREIQHHHVTGKFSLAARERGVILLGYSSGGSTSLPLTLETQESFYERARRELIKNVAFYTTAFVLILFSLVFMPVIRRRVQLAYAVYLFSVVLYVAHIDGYTFQLLWPSQPAWNSYASLPLGYGMAIFAAIFAREFMRTRTEDRNIDLLLNGVIWTTALLITSSLILDDQWLKKFGFLYICIVTLILVGCCLWMLRDRHPGMRFFTIGWLAIILSAVFSAIVHWSPGTFPVNASFDSMRLGVLTQGLMFAVAMAGQVQSFRRDRDAAMRREMRALEDNIALERSRAYAQALADARAAQLESASHDLKQPLVSLRLMLRRAIGPDQGETVATMRRSIDYLEGLVRRYLDQTAGAQANGFRHDGRHAASASAFEVSLVLDNVAAMFADESRVRSGKLRAVPSSARVVGDPMTVMRIVSNFVSNGVKHSTSGDVLLGCRRKGRYIRIEVHDKGPGLDEQQLDRLRNAHEDGSPLNAPENGGLGLSIALQLIADNGYGFDVRSYRGRGTVFALILPLA